MAEQRPRRPNRSAAERRAQYARAQGRVARALLETFKKIDLHRGQQLTVLGRAPSMALAGTPRGAPAEAAED